ncbi:GNAT family N-acetyltransferase [Aequorivita sp. CIP111184]|uniref:GNAT family N-acetyltransferase n=1 Tax=Aequorivita sp. CIP111184 TaxID=2211356 RepID=UPI000DBC105E|nr:GNAT family N-acetyltransferase [Aequorivita sp. CIP111184]SRX52620.1 dTDP-fucosamine acetyltransferase [Aequorivita sp. CIP111184]
MPIEKVNWDSEFFGYNVGKLMLSKGSSFSLQEFLKESESFKLVYIFSQDKLDDAPLRLMDEKVVFKYNLNQWKKRASNKNLTSFNFSIDGYEQLKQLSLKSGLYSRFSRDENFRNDEFQRMYLQWIENLVIKKEAFEIIVYIESNDILGFASLNTKEDNTANIGLVAVSNKARGKGIGSQLIEEAINIAAAKGFNSIEVVTQMENQAAVGLYKKCDFEIKSITNIYHYWNL